MIYDSLNDLGRGAFGTVYEALKRGTGRLLAVKIISKPENSNDNTMALVHPGDPHLLPSLNHPDILQVFLSHRNDPQVERVLSHMGERTVSHLHATYPPDLLPQLADSVLRQMLRALAFLDDLGFVHRDVKPENIFYNTTTTTTITTTTTTGGQHTHHFRLGDFGLCKRASAITAAFLVYNNDGEYDEYGYQHTRSVGTPGYLAPELHRDHPERWCESHKSDVWALYVTVLRVLAPEPDRVWEAARWGGRSMDSFGFRLNLAARAREDAKVRGLRRMAKMLLRTRVTAREMEKIVEAGKGGVVMG